MWRVALLVWIMAATALAGVGVMIVVATPDLAAQARKWIPLAAGAGALIAAPAALLVARAIARKPA